MREAKEDPGLTEVKAVLKKLQRLDLPAAGESGQGGTEETASRKTRKTKAARPSQASVAVFDRKRAAMERRPSRRGRGRRTLIYFLGAGAIAGGTAALFASGKVTVPEELKTFLNDRAAPGQHNDDEAALLTEARRLLSGGNVVLARTRLLTGEPDKRAELAFMLAQSYDPNYLRTLPNANSQPDRAEAERWYRKWYELAVSNGLEMDSGRLKRIISAMQ